MALEAEECLEDFLQVVMEVLMVEMVVALTQVLDRVLRLENLVHLVEPCMLVAEVLAVTLGVVIAPVALEEMAVEATAAPRLLLGLLALPIPAVAVEAAAAMLHVLVIGPALGQEVLVVPAL